MSLLDEENEKNHKDKVHLEKLRKKVWFEIVAIFVYSTTLILQSNRLEKYSWCRGGGMQIAIDSEAMNE